MTWTVNIAKRAEKQLAKAPAKSRRLLLAALEEMQRNPFTGNISRLKVRAFDLATPGRGL